MARAGAGGAQGLERRASASSSQTRPAPSGAAGELVPTRPVPGARAARQRRGGSLRGARAAGSGAALLGSRQVPRSGQRGCGAKGGMCVWGGVCFKSLPALSAWGLPGQGGVSPRGPSGRRESSASQPGSSSLERTPLRFFVPSRAPPPSPPAPPSRGFSLAQRKAPGGFLPLAPRALTDAGLRSRRSFLAGPGRCIPPPCAGAGLGGAPCSTRAREPLGG